jgi:hypothetical protein
MSDLGLPEATSETKTSEPHEPRSAASSRYKARDRAIELLLSEKLHERRSRAGAFVGIQAALEASTLGRMELGALVDLDPTDRPPPWRALLRKIETKLGAPLEPELFSNMLFVATLGADSHPALRALCKKLIGTFRDRHLGGLHHFFASPAFACDIDCTGVAARARLISGDLRVETPSSRAELRAITSSILRSACVADVTSKDNLTHGKENGPLFANVFKVYLDDHIAQAPALDRGLKVNPVVVANALYAVLYELRLGLRDPSERIALREHVEGLREPRAGEATVGAIVAANIDYASRWLNSGAFRLGCRYYPSPDTFLCFYSESVRAFPEAFRRHEAVWKIQAAIRARRDALTLCPADPKTPLNAALRAIAAKNVGLDASPEISILLAHQEASGAIRSPDSLYSLGSDPGMPVGFHSDILTTAFALRALSEYGPY